MTEKTLNLRGLKCPLPALRAKKALAGMAAGDLLTIECTDPLTVIDIPNLLRQTGDTLEGKSESEGLLTFTIRKVSFGVGVERTYPLNSPQLDRIEIVTRGDVRRAKTLGSRADQ